MAQQGQIPPVFVNHYRDFLASVGKNLNTIMQQLEFNELLAYRRFRIDRGILHADPALEKVIRIKQEEYPI